MQYRRFGKTNKHLSVITLGGMRFANGWDSPKEEIPNTTLDEAVFSVNRAMELGINHIETAQGYMKSEKAFGLAFDELNLDRNRYHLMTKGAPATAAEVRPMIENQLELLKTDHFDFYGWHGINTDTILDSVIAKGGPVEELLKLKEEGIVKHVGFSTHGRVETISRAINSDLFEFVNLHYYYFFQRNRASIDLAELKDMGVFIISPNDKGGQLFSPPQKLKNLTKPLTPLQWNARFCLATPAVHTLTFGIHQEPHFKEMLGIFPFNLPLSKGDRAIKNQLDKQYLSDPFSDYDGYDLQNDATGINIPEYLRLRKMWKCFDMEEFGKYRYNMHSPSDHWVHGELAYPNLVEKIDDSRVPEGIDVKALLNEMHSALYVKKS